MSEWGPWIEHDGGPCPYALGDYIGVRFKISAEVEGRVTELVKGASSWFTNTHPLDPVTHHRLRKPRGMTMLEILIADLPAPTRKVDA